MDNNTPKISVVMSCYNRKDYVSDAIESILNQTYKDFEFIIIDDCSTDGTREIIQKYADNDSRIVFIKNAHNLGLISNLNTGLELAKGEYIARMDDDDISLPERFEKQVKYLDEHQDITVLGTFIETFGKEDSMSWVNECDSSIINIIINFFNPMCHPTVMIRNKFLKEHHLQYAAEALHAEEYDLWKNISLKGGKLANLPEILLKYRVHENSITLSKKTRKIQRDTANKIKTELLKRYFNPKETNNIITTINKYPFEANNKIFLYKTLNKMKNAYSELNLDTEPIVQTIEKYCGVPSQMEIFFASDDKFTQHLSVAMASILINSLPIETFNFYILDGGISEKNKKKILQLKSIKDFNIEFIKIDDILFKDCVLTPDCQHISKQTYYRYIIPKIKPNIDKCFYFDCDLVVVDSLNNFWNLNLSNKYCVVVEELYKGSFEDKKRLGINNYFNAGVMLINNKLWKQNNISDILFENTAKISDKIRWVDQDVLNYTFKDDIIFISPIYNLQQNAFYDGHSEKYSCKELEVAKKNPTIIHYNGCYKPWHTKCLHPMWKKYLIYLKYTPFKTEYYYIFIRKYLKGLHLNMFGIQKTEKHKIISFLGFKLKIKRKKKRGGGMQLPNEIIELELAKIQDSFLWDALWYIKKYNYNFYRREALEYWYSAGWKKGESPSKYLNVEFYQKRYNVKDRNPLLHYLDKGRFWNFYPDNKNNYKSKEDEKKITDYLAYKQTRQAKSVVYTCITNNYDDIFEIKTYKYINKEWDYICFTDNEEHIKLGQIGIWKILPLQCNENDATLNNRWHKTHPHILFPNYEESIYIDANINILTNKLFETIKEKDNDLLLPIHFNNVCIYYEYEWALQSSIDKRENVEKGLKTIKEAGMPHNYGFTENNILYRKHHNSNIIELMEEWWNFIITYTKRDQLSFSYQLWKHKIEVEDITFQNARIDINNFYVFDHKKGRNSAGI